MELTLAKTLAATMEPLALAESSEEQACRS